MLYPIEYLDSIIDVMVFHFKFDYQLVVSMGVDTLVEMHERGVSFDKRYSSVSE